MPHRPERLAEMIREELTEMIEGELADPRIGLAAITSITLPPPARVADIYIQVVGDDREQQSSLQGLLAARGYLRAELALRLQLRRVPEIRFHLDKSEQIHARLEQLLARSHKRNPVNPPEENE